MSGIITNQNEVHKAFLMRDHNNVERADEVLAMRAANLLNKHYPGHLWAVHVNSEGGVMNIKALNLSGLYGMVLHLKNVYQDSQLNCVIRSGGEFLERCHKKRGSHDGSDPTILEGAKKQHQPFNGIIV